MAKKAENKYYATGRRKSSVARVYLVPGSGKVTINKRDMDDYFGLETLKLIVNQPFEATSTQSKFDVIVEFYIGHGICDIDEINYALFKHDQQLLGVA